MAKWLHKNKKSSMNKHTGSSYNGLSGERRQKEEKHTHTHAHTKNGCSKEYSTGAHGRGRKGGNT